MKNKPIDEYPISFETFREVGSPYSVSEMRSNEPSSFNGWVRFRKYRVTIELVEEPIEVLRDRLQYLWDYCDNHHQWQPLKNAAASIGVELAGDAGNKRIVPKWK